MTTVSIPQEEYEELKRLAEKIKVIDQTIHEDISTSELMRVEEKSASYNFLEDEGEDIYTEDDVKEK